MLKNSLVLTTVVVSLLTALSVNSQDTTNTNDKLIRSVNSIHGRYIVVMKAQIGDSAITGSRAESSVSELSTSYGVVAEKVYTSAITGFAAGMSDEAAELLSRDERVLFVEEDAFVTASSEQTNATWSLDRIDQRNYPLNNTYAYSATGSGVNAYVIDSGIRITHSDFGGRAAYAADFIGDGQNGNDCFGHGTHVAGTIGSSTYGVAKGVSLHGLRVLGCDGTGSVSGILAAVNWVTANASFPAVANLSIVLSGPSNSLDTAINNSIAAGITYTLAAGNFGMDACAYSPARIANAITVGSSVVNGSNDWQMSYSNYGRCVDLFAPGNGIVSLSHADDSSFRSMNGTSMAAPHVAGAAALYLEQNPNASASNVTSVIKNGATKGTIVNVDSTSPNKVLYSLLGNAEPQTSAEIAGRVLGRNDRGLSGIVLTIRDAASTFSRDTITDDGGEYTFSGIPTSALYTVTVGTGTKYTFTPETRTFHLDGDLDNVDFSVAN
jgi:subtilisin family serine protease